MGKAPSQALHLRVADASIFYSLGSAALLVVTAGFLWTAPALNGPAALALAVAVALEAASRLAAEAVSRRAGVSVAMRGLPSVVLPLGATPSLAAAILATLALLAPGQFPVVASLIAGLVAMGALARLSLTRSVLVLSKAEREPLPRRSGGSDPSSLGKFAG